MTADQAHEIARLVSEYLQLHPDRQSPFRKNFEGDPEAGRARERTAFQSFHDIVIAAKLSDRRFADLECGEFDVYAYLCLISPGAPDVPPADADHIAVFSVLRCAFPCGRTRTEICPDFVIAYGCGNWRQLQNHPQDRWSDAVAQLDGMVKFAARGSELWIRTKLYGAGQYCNNNAVLAAAQDQHTTPFEVPNLCLVETLLGHKQNIEAQANFAINWHHDVGGGEKVCHYGGLDRAAGVVTAWLAADAVTCSQETNLGEAWPQVRDRTCL